MAQLKCPAIKQNTTHVNKQKSYTMIEFSLSSLLLFMSWCKCQRFKIS